jgi:hypothetical protein
MSVFPCDLGGPGWHGGCTLGQRIKHIVHLMLGVASPLPERYLFLFKNWEDLWLRLTEK